MMKIWAQTYADIFNCHVETFPIKYLGVPVSPSRLHVCDSYLRKVKKDLIYGKVGQCP